MSDAAASGMRRRETTALAVLVAAALAYWTLFRAVTGIVLEDALITFRFAENLAAGHGFSYNPGEVVHGTTTPLLTLLLAAAAALFGPERIPLVANVLLLSAGGAAVACLHLALREWGLGARASLAAAALAAFHPEVVWTTAGGMETPLVLLGIAASLLAATRARYVLAGALLGLLVLARIDGLAFALALGVVAAVRRPSAIPRLALGFALVTLPWIAYATAVLGGPIPHSLVAKRMIAPGTSDGASFAGLPDFVAWFLGGLGVRIGRSAFGLFALASVLALSGFGILACATRARRSWLAVLPLYGCVLGAAYYLGDAPRNFDWYLVPVTFCAVPLIVAGASELFAATRAWVAACGADRRVAVAFVAAFVAAPAVYYPYASWKTFELQSRYQCVEEGLRREVGEWLRASTEPGASVAMEAIGYQGTFARRRVIDLAGLVSPEVVRIHSESSSPPDAFRRVLDELRPDYLVLRAFEREENRSFFGGLLVETDEQRAALAKYVEVARFDAPERCRSTWGPLGHLVVLRREVE